MTEAGVIRVLVVSPLEEDHRALKAILRGSKWSLYRADDLPSALAQLRNGPAVSLVLCERNLPKGTWKDLWASLSEMQSPPLLVVTSHWADEQLWAEALNLGAYDVLATPFEAAEVVRSLNTGWLHKRHRDCPTRAIETACG